jgi:hypothetical protein
MAVKLQLRRDTSANWSATNPVLAEGEIGIDTTLRSSKIGDGATAWNSLPYGLTQSAPGMRYSFSTTVTDSDPGAGTLRFNNAAAGSTTFLYFDNADLGGATITAWLDALDDSTTPSVKGILRIQKAHDRTVYREFTVTGAVVDGTGYRKVPVTFIVESGSLSNGDEVLVTFFRAGDRGASGAGTGDMLSTNNLSDVANAETARTNLGLKNANDLAVIAALADPNADRILFWDDSAGAFTYLEIGSGLAITGTQISSTGTDGSGARTFYRYVATAGQTTFSGADANALTLAYTVGKIDVHVNGRLISSDDYTATSTTSVVFDSGLTVGDEVIITAYSGVLNLTAWTAASASGPASLAFAEDTDNGAHTVTLKAPASVAASVDVTLPNAAGTILGTGAETLSAANQTQARNNISAALKGHIFGLTASNAADADHDLTFAIGEAASTETNPVLMKLLSSLTKQFDATWAVGDNAGGMQSGSSLPTSGTVHVHLIERSDTGVVDIIGVPNGTTLVLPSGYDRSRRIMSFRTDSSANIRAFKQKEDSFYYNTALLDYSSTSSRAFALLTLSIPSGIVCRPIIYIRTEGGSSGSRTLLNFIANADATSAAHILINGLGDGNFEKTGGNSSLAYSNTSAQINFEVSLTGASILANYLYTLGWIDNRGKDA